MASVKRLTFTALLAHASKGAKAHASARKELMRRGLYDALRLLPPRALALALLAMAPSALGATERLRSASATVGVRVVLLTPQQAQLDPVTLRPLQTAAQTVTSIVVTEVVQTKSITYTLTTVSFN